MVERFAARLGRFDENAQILAGRFLAGEVVKRQGPDRGIRIVVALFRRDEAAGRRGQRAVPSKQ
jgi:hypothetical protein